MAAMSLNIIQDESVGVDIGKVRDDYGGPFEDCKYAAKNSRKATRGQSTVRTNSVTPPDSRTERSLTGWSASDCEGSKLVWDLGRRKPPQRLANGSGYGEPEEEAENDDDDDRSSTRLTQSDLDGFSSAEEESLIAEDEVNAADACPCNEADYLWEHQDEDKDDLLGAYRCGGCGVNQTGGRGRGPGAASPARGTRSCRRHGAGAEVRGKLCRGRPLRRPRARPELFIEIEDKASDPPVKHPAPEGQRKARTVLVRRQGDVEIEEELEGFNEALCGCLRRCLNRANAICYALIGPPRFDPLEQDLDD